ncbi:MAG: hypothetical protein ABI175_07570, partial [Polyangiales bacterium]
MSTTTKPGRLRRWASLFGFGSAPGTADETRVFLQRRLSLFFGVMTAFGTIFYTVGLVMTLTYFPVRMLHWFFDTTRLLHFAMSGSCLACWFYTRERSHRSLVALGNLDAIGSIVLMTGTA